MAPEGVPAQERLSVTLAYNLIGAIGCVIDIELLAVQPFASVAVTLYAVSYTHLTLPTKRIV